MYFWIHFKHNPLLTYYINHFTVIYYLSKEVIPLSEMNILTKYILTKY
ncbi:hypothetical protein KCTC32420_01839 [Aequorivita nionensis]